MCWPIGPTMHSTSSRMEFHSARVIILLIINTWCIVTKIPLPVSLPLYYDFHVAALRIHSAFYFPNNQHRWLKRHA
ncbi:hypothetical protein K431DRAFT_31192 [Polychaeton citri CBS 116435]|uniref:Uncharacterized protein n=1 Tax=Polychaeton citri CBS 116435 TaxID=1314669 RepID=A0A9P4USG1_9PEZI|nr:hypothetical protein K431DRAFT_31192 [Polychaeton citri CBS 116435]